jgi:hypothetical protein
MLNDRRRRSEGVNESQSKNLYEENLIYVPKFNQHASLLAQPRPYSYRKAIVPRNRLRQFEITVEDDTRCNQRHMRDYYDKNRTKKQLSHYMYFTEYLTDVFEKPQRKSN